MDRIDFNNFAEIVRHKVDAEIEGLCEGHAEAEAVQAWLAAASGALASAANILGAYAKAAGLEADAIEEMRDTYERQFLAHLDRACAAELLN